MLFSGGKTIPNFYPCLTACVNVEILGGAGEALSDLKQLFFLAEKFGYSEWIQFDASVVRGLAYYTGVVFEVRFMR